MDLQTLRMYLSNVGKLFDLLLEMLYVLSVICAAGILMGDLLSFQDWYGLMTTDLKSFFYRLMILLMFILVVAAFLPVLAIALLEVWNFLYLRAAYVVFGKNDKTYKDFVRRKEDIALTRKGVKRVFEKLGDNSFENFKALLIEKVVTTRARRVVSISIIYFVILFKLGANLGWIDCFVIFMVVSSFFQYSLLRVIENAIGDGTVFYGIERERLLNRFRKDINQRKECSPLKVSDNDTRASRDIFVVRDIKSKQINGFIVIASEEMSRSWSERFSSRLGKSPMKVVIIDPHHNIPDECVKDTSVHRDAEDFNIVRVLNEILAGSKKNERNEKTT